MEQVGLNVLADLFSDKIAMAGNTGGDSGNQLFRGLLEKSVHSGKADERSRGLCSSEERPESETGIGMLENTLRQIGLPMGQLKVPKSAIPELVNLLEGRGFQREEIRSLLASLSDKDGSIRVDRLLAKLQKNKKFGRENQDLVIQAKDIPFIGEALAAMGLGAGKIKEVIEGATNAKGELSLERLTGRLSATLPGMDVKSLLAAVLERSQVQGTAKAETKLMADPDVRTLVNDLANTSDQEAQKRIRDEMAKLLRQKGVAPQEVKSIVENLTVSHAKVLSKSAGMDPEGAKMAEADAKALMDKVVLSADRKQPSDGWKEKIMQFLQKDKGLGKESLQKNPLQEEGFSKMSSAEQVKSGEQKSRVVMDAARSTETKHKSGPEPSDTAGTRKGNAVDLKPGEGITADLSAIRIQKDNVESVTAARAKDMAALPDPLPKILDRMLWMIQGGEQKGRIQISPPELGRLDIDLVIKQGHLQAQLNAENPQVKELIEANLGQLKQHLADIGLVIDRFDVMIGLEQNPFSKEQAWTAGNRRGNSSRKDRDEDGPLLQNEPAAPASRSYSLSQIDMLV